MAIKPLKTIKFPELPDTYTIPQVDTIPTQGSSNAVSSGGVYTEFSALKEDLNILTEKNLEFVETATAGATNAYKVIENKLLVGVEYAFKVTSRIAGTYLFQAGIGQSASSMYDIGTYTFGAGETKTITGYSTDNSNIKYFRLYSADMPLSNMDWDVSVYTYYDAKTEIDNVSERIDTGINEVNEEIIETWGTVLVESIPVSDLSSNWYKGISNNLASEEYDFVITAQTAGTYLFQIGYGGSASAMSLTVGEYTFLAGETKRITFTPIGNNLKYFRFYSESVPVTNTIWTLKIEQVITAEDLQNTDKKVDNIITAMECEVISTMRKQYFNTKADTVDITAPTANNSWNCAIVTCVSGDVFTITGRGGDTPRLWAFIDGNGNVISRQDSTLNPSKVKDYELYAPENSAYLIVNFMNTEEYLLVKGVSLKKRFEISDYELKDTTAHIVHVAVDGSGDYTTLTDAYAAITDSAFDNQYEIIVHDGTYTEQYLTPPPYTHTHGTKADNVIITSVGLPYYDSISDWASVFQMLNTCKLSNLTVISGTKYCIHEDDPKLSKKLIVCENVKFYQTQAHNVSVVGNGTQFGGTKYVFRDCTFINGAVAVHTNTQMIAGANQHMILDSCKFIDAYVSLQSVVTTEMGNQGLYVCEIKNCRFKSGVFAVELRIGNAISGSNIPNFPWTLCGSGNENFGIRFDVSRDSRFSDCWDAVNTIEKTFVKASEAITKGDYVTESGEVTTQENAYGISLTNAVSGDYVPVWIGAIYPAVTV